MKITLNEIEFNNIVEDAFKQYQPENTKIKIQVYDWNSAEHAIITFVPIEVEEVEKDEDINIETETGGDAL